MRSLLVAAAAFLLTLSAWCESPPLSRSPRELGLVVLRELSVAEGTVTIRVDSNGCTGKQSLKVTVRSDPGLSVAGVPHFRLSIERVVADECKAMLWDGVSIELDMEKDLGLGGTFTLSVDNPVSVRIPVKEKR